ncbi:N-acetylmuramoyl-L-alanine amidase family protein [Clostridium sp.]|uniref:N-acetylmuramoyl-L-alanine amidase family protein n=1 Tax=Clostridium sp. TaxID=1506 RepID=UPI0026230BA9|nr:N-acetylmuramoyl-L-alanine amidase family protein [Clostridium sp.]
MIKRNVFKKMLLFISIFTAVVSFGIINEIKASGESNGWVYTDNSWRYYSGPSIQTGWCLNNGNWYYLDDNGRIKTGWIKSEGKWYYLDPSTGKMITGWIEDRGKWYYLNTSGEMVTGWLEYNGNLYYLNTSGVMVKDVYIGSYYLGPDGTWREGSCISRK